MNDLMVNHKYNWIKDFYNDAAYDVAKGKPFSFLYFHFYNNTPKDHNFAPRLLRLIDYVLDSYSDYKSAGYTVFDSKVYSLLDGLEVIVDECEQQARREDFEDEE